MEKIKNGKKMECVQQDITKLKVDAIINAANESLVHAGGVARAISKAGGKSIQQQSNEWVKKNGPVRTGSAAVTGAGDMDAKYIIHAVGPVMGSGEEDEKLKSAIRSALQIAEEYKLKSIAFPAISTGIFGYPLKKCAKIMMDQAEEFLKSSTFISHIIFCLYDDNAYKIFTTECAER